MIVALTKIPKILQQLLFLINIKCSELVVKITLYNTLGVKNTK